MTMGMKDRSTGELLVLAVAVTVCGYVIVSGVFLMVVIWVHPTADVTGAARNIADIINTLIGLLAGFLAGRQTNVNGKDTPK